MSGQTRYREDEPETGNLGHKTRVKKAVVALASLALVLSSAPALPAAGRSEMIEARQKFFGKSNVNARTGAVRRDRVIFSWFSVASYAASFNGHVVLIDAWIARGSHSGYVPTTPEELAALDPEFIFIGHGDFDHAADAAEVVRLSGAAIVGTQEHCDSIEEQLGAPVDCVSVAPAGATPGLARELRIIPGVEISAIVHVHSSFESPEQTDGGRAPCPHRWNPGDTAEHPPNPEDVEHLVTHLGDARGGNVLYQFRIDELSVAWHDTTGKLKEDAPAAIEAIEALPPTDIQFGAILAFGQVTNCFRSLRMYIDALRPDIFTPTHHDNFTYGIGGNARDLEPMVREEIDRIPKKRRPKVFFTYDPTDYIKPKLFTFDPKARSFRE